MAVEGPGYPGRVESRGNPSPEPENKIASRSRRQSSVTPSRLDIDAALLSGGDQTHEESTEGEEAGKEPASHGEDAHCYDGDGVERKANRETSSNSSVHGRGSQRESHSLRLSEHKEKTVRGYVTAS